MKLKLIAYVLITFSVLSSCSTKTKQCKAKIIERKTINDSMIMINYSFEMDGKYYLDSVITGNKQIEPDSILVEFSANNPENNNVIFPQ
jgi:hypothetical protein